MRFEHARRALIWVGASALVAGGIGVADASAVTAGTASVGATTASGIKASTATLSASVNPNGTDTTATAICQGVQPFVASSTSLTGTGNTTVTISLTGLTGFGKYVCRVIAKQTGKANVESQIPAAFFTTALPPAHALYVDGNPPQLGGGGQTTGCTGPGAQACQTIQQAVNAAQALSNSTATIHVKAITAFGPGSAYSEAVTIAAPDTVRIRIKGSENPVVRGLLGKPVFSITGPTALSGSSPRVTLTGLTIAGGEASGNSGGGVSVSGDLVWVANNTITENRGDTGAGIYNNSTNQLTLINNTIVGNLGGTASTLGVAVFTLQGSTVLMNNTMADNPPTGTGTGLDVGAQGSYRLINSILVRTTCGNPKAGTDGGHNVESGNTCGLDAATNRVSNNAVNLAGSLAANGSTGPMTLAIGNDSSAHNFVPLAECTVTFDARGFGRPGTDPASCDAGAFEIQAPAMTPTIGPPTASDVTDTTATLTAQVNPGGAPTTMDVSCTGGPYNWSATSPGTGRSAGPATASLTGLTPGTAYSCAMSASNSAGGVTSPAATFTTLTTAPATPTPAATPAPTPAATPAGTPTPAATPAATPAPPAASAPSVGNTSVSAVDTDSASLSAAVTPNGAPTAATATCTGGAWQAGGASAGSGSTSSTVTVPLTGLSGGTTYTCSVTAKNSAGETTSPGSVTFTTAGPTKATAPTKTTAKMTITAKAFKAKKGKTATYTVATFTDASDAPAKNYVATINWGDGTTSKGKVVKTGKGTYKITGKHKYKTAGAKGTKVTVAKTGFSGVTAKGRATAV